jgi:hypothetical protein
MLLAALQRWLTRGCTPSGHLRTSRMGRRIPRGPFTTLLDVPPDDLLAAIEEVVDPTANGWLPT